MYRFQFGRRHLTNGINDVAAALRRVRREPPAARANGSFGRSRISQRLALLFCSLLALACGDVEKVQTSGAGGTDGSQSSDVFGRIAPSTGCTGDCGPTVDRYFDNQKLATLKLTFDERTLETLGFASDTWLDLLWDKWKVCAEKNVWIPAKLEYESPDGEGNAVLERVGVRLRGTKSRGVNPLQGMKIEFENLIPKPASGESRRRFAGMNQINLLSVEKDKSAMVQCMSYKLMRDAGAVAPRCNQVKVYVNGAYYGLMENVEKANDARFLRHHFGTPDGSLYGGSTSCELGLTAADLAYHGDSFDEHYSKAYETLRGGPAEKDLIPMLKCSDTSTTPDDEEFKTCISEWLDVQEWLNVIAGESLMPGVDSFVGARRNVYLYFKPDAEAPHGGRMLAWGWDYDTALHRSACHPPSCDPFTAVAAWYGPRGARPKLVTRLTSVFKQQYCDTLNRFLSDLYRPELVDEMARVVEPGMLDSPVVGHDEWLSEVATMRTYFETHRVAAQALVDKRCN